MGRSSSVLRDRTGMVALVAVMWSALLAQPAFCQDHAKAEVNRIRKDYARIVSELDRYKKAEVRWQAGPESPGAGISYTGYFDKRNKLVLLKYSQGEEGYWSEHEYYFRDEEVFFLFIRSGTPEGAEKEERIYIAGKVIVQALLRSSDAGDNRKISDLENKRYDAVMDDIAASSRKYYLGVQRDLDQFNAAMNKR